MPPGAKSWDLFYPAPPEGEVSPSHPAATATMTSTSDMCRASISALSVYIIPPVVGFCRIFYLALASARTSGVQGTLVRARPVNPYPLYPAMA